MKKEKNDKEEDVVYVEYTPENKDSEIKSEKAKKLLKKVAKLCEKINKEKSPLKRQILATKVRSLRTKIDKQIEIEKIKKSYENIRQNLVDQKENAKKNREKFIGIETMNIKKLIEKAHAQKDFDYESGKFLYDDEIVDRYGGIDGLIDAYENSGDQDFIDIAKEIKNAKKIREELKSKREFLDQLRQEDIDSNYKQEEKRINKHEKSLIKKEKGNIFQKIGSFFRNVKQGVSDYFAEKKNVKDQTKKIYEENAKNQFQNEKKSIREEIHVDIDNWKTEDLENKKDSPTQSQAQNQGQARS